jgi:hypothetical protein
MKGFANPLARKRMPGYPGAIEHIKTIVRTVLDLSDEVTVSVTELACRDSGCPDIETVVAILWAGRKPLTVRFHQPIPEISDGDLQTALSRLTRREGDSRG